MTSNAYPVTSQPPSSQYPQPQPQYPQPQPQYGAQPITAVAPVIQQVKMDAYPQNVREWSTGLFDCMSDTNVCLFGWCCCCILTCQVADDMGESLLTPFFDVTGLRVKLRTMFGIKGSVIADTCAICCCPPCAVCQMKREMKTSGMCS